MTPGLVSIVIVTHNNASDIELAVSSAVHQSYPRVEVIVVDNASTDGTEVLVAQRFGDRVRYLRQAENRFDGGGYNAGFRAARGEFIQFLDADDFLAPEKIETQVAVFQANPQADIVRGRFRRFQRHAGQAVWVDADAAPPADLLGALIASTNVGAETGLLIHSLLFRRRTLERLGEWDETIIGADLDFFLRAAWAACRFAECPESLCFYQVRPGQMSADVATHLANREKTWAKALEYVTEEPYRSAIAKKLARLRFCVATSRGTRSRRERLELLRQAYRTHSEALSPAAVGVGWVLTVVPGARALLAPRWLHQLRSQFATSLGLK